MYILNEFDTRKRKDTEEESTKFTLLMQASLVGMAQFVFVVEKLIDSVYDLRTFTYGTGFLGISGNKGAVGCSFCLFDTPVAFINCHFAAAYLHRTSKGGETDLTTILSEARFDKDSYTSGIFHTLVDMVSGDNLVRSLGVRNIGEGEGKDASVEHNKESHEHNLNQHAWSRIDNVASGVPLESALGAQDKEQRV